MIAKPGTDLAKAPHTDDTSVERSAAFRAARHHSLRVRVLKLALPVLALTVMTGFVAWSWVSSPVGVSFDVTGTSYADGKLVMANPKLEGFARNNLPYVMTAMQAVQDAQASGIFELETIDAKLPIDADRWATLQAPRGVYNRDTNTIEFDGKILITTTDGLTARFSRAFIDIGNGDLQTSEPVDIDTGSAKIMADSMKSLENGKVLIFENRVRMRIMPERVGIDEKPIGDTDDS